MLYSLFSEICLLKMPPNMIEQEPDKKLHIPPPINDASPAILFLHPPTIEEQSPTQLVVALDVISFCKPPPIKALQFFILFRLTP